MIKSVAVATIVAFCCVSCSSSTIIKSVPAKAKVYVNDEYKGETPYTLSTRSIIGSSTKIKLAKRGFADYNTEIKRDEKANIPAIVGGIFCLPFFLWATDYDPEHTYKLKRK
ncbi:MAG TPA: PEGA domain-containing protein [Spirochaetota bacterium]|nr:PEGA domain-containing protein [Spirochaetota bacterium]HNT12885.1 PEGA domain-containing protein [Spirochaetota bacterium]